MRDLIERARIRAARDRYLLALPIAIDSAEAGREASSADAPLTQLPSYGTIAGTKSRSEISWHEIS